jgi:preprotein translocase subunit YajC
MHLNCLNVILADGAVPASTGAAASPTQALLGQVPFFILIAVIFYFVLIRPQQQRAKQQKKLLEALKSGDKVVTAAGIIGTVITVKETTVTLRSADAKFEVTKVSVTEIITPDASTPTAS